MPSEPDDQSSPTSDPQPVRNQLAIDRTILANERTVLAYVRTALTMLIVSVALIKFIESLVIVIIGIALIPLAVVVAFVGLRRYRRRRETITRLYGQTPLTPPGIEPSQVESSSVQNDES
jgi:putative membrane protein